MLVDELHRRLGADTKASEKVVLQLAPRGLFATTGYGAVILLVASCQLQRPQQFKSPSSLRTSERRSAVTH